ncbi:DUF896 domain-containing protein [uncultured Cardiobacterium sp.]|uniref:DUF896 domain-containing protein n=1 Tax=uncultured Cardiobacterium sp. TaxID=417619 RepID=UPI00261FEE9D|nr:DUF896 domain-containing protein [uncultured Cardiobacterium sp.]
MTIPALTRINELAAIAKTRALTADELAERDGLRREYLAAIRGQVDNNLLVTRIVDSEGNDVTPQKLRAAQAAKQNPQ